MTRFEKSSFQQEVDQWSTMVDHGGSAGFITGNGNMAHIFENTAGKLLELLMTVT